MTEQLPTEPGCYLGRTGVLYRLGTDHIFRDETGRKRWVNETLTRLVPLSVEDRTLIRGLAAIAEVYRSPWVAEHADAIQALAARIAPNQNGDGA